MTISPKLLADVKMVNRVHRHCLELFPQLCSALSPFNGKKVLNANGELLGKVKLALPEFNYPDIQVLFYKNTFNVQFIVKTSECIPDKYTIYYEYHLAVAQLENGVIVKFNEPPHLQYDYNAEEIDRCRERIKELNELVREEKSKISVFGEYDRY